MTPHPKCRLAERLVRAMAADEPCGCHHPQPPAATRSDPRDDARDRGQDHGPNARVRTVTFGHGMGAGPRGGVNQPWVSNPGPSGNYT